MNDTTQPNRKRDFAALIFAMILPTIVTWVYFVVLKSASPTLQQVAYSIGKTIQFAFPVVFVWLFYRERFKQRTDKPNDYWMGPLFGFFAVGLMFGLYFLVLKDSDTANMLMEKAGGKFQSMGLASVWAFAGTGLFYALFHSFMEEYYWRWFVFDLWKKFVPVSAAVVLSAIGFMSHHVILLAEYLGWDSIWTYLLSASIAVGGIAWAVLYQRTGRLLSPWISHMIVDAGIFALGYLLVREVL